MNSPQPPPPPQQYEIEVHLSDYLNVFLRRNWIFLLAFLAVSWGWRYTFTMGRSTRPAPPCTSRQAGQGGILGECR
jgi:hypothetical protein